MSLRSFMGRLLGFREPPPAPREPIDRREWNEDWKVGDTAECIVDGVNLKWSEEFAPWERPSFGQQLTVIGFSAGLTSSSLQRAYFLHFEEWPRGVETRAFRKVRPVAAEQSEVVSRILNAKPGTDRVREDV